MNSKLCKTLFFISIILIPVFTGLPQGKKGVKISSPATQVKLRAEQQKNYNNIVKKLKEFINQKGLTVFQNKSSLTDSVTVSPPHFKIAPPNLKGTSVKNENVIYDKKTGMPIFIKVTPQTVKRNGTLNTSGLITSGKAFLLKERELLKVEDPESEFELKRESKDNFGITHLRFNQKYKGLEVWGKEIIVHLDKSGNVISLNGRSAPTPSVIQDTTGKIPPDEAINISLNKSGIIGAEVSRKIKELTGYNGPVAKKIIWYDKSRDPHLAWFVEVRKGLSQDWYYFIDANDGRVLNHYNNVCYDGAATGTGKDLNGMSRNFSTYQVGSTYYMIDASQPMFDAASSQLPDKAQGAIICLDIKNKDLSNDNSIYYVTSSSNAWTDPAAISAHNNAITTYKYFLNVFNRNSVDDKGMTIYSIVHVTDNNQPMENAFWSGKVMCYGDGGQTFKPLAGGLDVAAHEMTHGVTQYSANLEYQGQSGALNESMSDVFGVMVDSLNWTMGEKIVKDFNTFSSGALRDFSNPHNGGTTESSAWQPANMDEFVNTTKDNGGVHINSGIPNHAFYLAAKSIDRNTAAKIWYRALTVYLTHSSQFIDARIATVNAASDLYGASSTQVTEVKKAWDAVGVAEGTGTTPPPPSTISGDNWVLLINTSPDDPNSIYMAKNEIQSESDFFPISRTPVLNKPAVSDGSGLIIFVDIDNNLRMLQANPNNPSETILDSSGVWWGAAIGPGLTSLALTSKYADTTIYYFDLVNEVSTAFKIATKSYDAADVRTALYADALSFDPTGQYLLFDSYNEIKNASGGKLSFWTINNLAINTGKMESVFPPLPEGINVGNPSFSKTSQTRFTFDYWDENKAEDYVMAADFNTGKSGIVAGPLSVIGYPSYSGDDKIIAFHATESYQGTTHDAVNKMTLKDNMIEGTGTPQGYVVDATYPSWFVIGTRTTGTKDKPGYIPASFILSQNYPNPFNPTTTINYAIPKSSFVTIKVYDILGNEVAALVSGMKASGNYKVEFNASKLSSGVYFYRIQAGSFVKTKKLILLK